MKKTIYLFVFCLFSQIFMVFGQRQMEKLSRGLVATNMENGKNFVSWRILSSDPDDIAFNVYRAANGGAAVKLNSKPLLESSSFTDSTSNISQTNVYSVKPLVKGVEQSEKNSFSLTPKHLPYISIPIKAIVGDTAFKYAPNDASVGDLDGDGEYEIIIKRELSPKDNTQSGVTGQTKLEAYKLNGTFLWRIDLGINIREGAHYTPFIVYDFDGDGKAEIAIKTSEGTTFGDGKSIGDINKDGKTNYVDANGFILEGPEFLSIIEGSTGKELARTDYIARGDKLKWKETWGDEKGNKMDRFLMGVGYFDGKRPSLVICRGYYEKTVLQTLNWRDGKITLAWTFDSESNEKNKNYRGQGNHNLQIGDIDGDGKDEIVYGSCTIDDNGLGLYSTLLGHGDAMHLSDLDPDHQGLEVFAVHESPSKDAGTELREAKTGKVMWGLPSAMEVGKGLSADIDPKHKGSECWSSGQNELYNCKGVKIGDNKPISCNFAIWWDGDLLRELLDKNAISKWDYLNQKTKTIFSPKDVAANNGPKATPCLSADIFGDWREEVIFRTANNRELRIYTSTIPTQYRFCTLMQDDIYRLGVATQNVGFNLPAKTGFYLGDGMKYPRNNVKK